MYMLCPSILTCFKISTPRANVSCVAGLEESRDSALSWMRWASAKSAGSGLSYRSRDPRERASGTPSAGASEEEEAAPVVVKAGSALIE
jgi:hypothetical protein